MAEKILYGKIHEIKMPTLTVGDNEYERKNR